MLMKSWSKIPKGNDHLEDLGVDGRIILECIFIRLRTRTSGGLL
jgi:hypothetical protein